MVADVQYIVGNKREKEVPVADLAPIINQNDKKYEYEDEDADNDDLDQGRSMETASRWVGVLSGWNLKQWSLMCNTSSATRRTKKCLSPTWSP